MFSLPPSLPPSLHANCLMTPDLCSQGYFFQQLQWFITTFIGKLDITDYIVILQLFSFYFYPLTLYLLFHDLLLHRHMQDNKLSGTLNVLQDLPLKDLYVHTLFSVVN